MIFAPSLAISTAPLRRIYSAGTGGLSLFSLPMSSLSKKYSVSWRWKCLQAGILQEPYFPLHLRVWRGGTESLTVPCQSQMSAAPCIFLAYQFLVHREMTGLASSTEDIVPNILKPHPFAIAINGQSEPQTPSSPPRQEVTAGQKGTQTLQCDILSP